MVQYFSFDILKPTGPLPFTNISFLSYKAKYSLRVNGNLLVPWFNVYTLYTVEHNKSLRTFK